MAEPAKYIRVKRGNRLIDANHEKADLLGRVFEKALGKSDWVARSGVPSNFYFNLDKVYKDFTLTKEDLREAHEVLAGNIEDHIRSVGANCLGFIFPNQGPVGVVQLRSVLAERIPVPTIVVHINERLLRNQIWFEQKGSETPPLGPRSRVLLFCDTATSGASIYRAALIVRKFNAECSNALVLFDRLQGADEKLAVKQVELASLLDRNFFEKRGSLSDIDLKLDKKASRLEFESVSATI
jgi:orotate phosphoribosyltransferase